MSWCSWSQPSSQNLNSASANHEFNLFWRQGHSETGKELLDVLFFLGLLYCFAYCNLVGVVTYGKAVWEAMCLSLPGEPQINRSQPTADALGTKPSLRPEC